MLHSIARPHNVVSCCTADELPARLTCALLDGGWVQLWTCYVLEAYAVNLWSEKGMCGPIHLYQAPARCACSLTAEAAFPLPAFHLLLQPLMYVGPQQKLARQLAAAKLVQTQDSSELAAAKLCIHSLPALRKAVRPVRGCAGKPVKSAQGPDQLQFNAPLWHNWWIGMMW